MNSQPRRYFPHPRETLRVADSLFYSPKPTPPCDTSSTSASVLGSPTRPTQTRPSTLSTLATALPVFFSAHTACKPSPPSFILLPARPKQSETSSPSTTPDSRQHPFAIFAAFLLARFSTCFLSDRHTSSPPTPLSISRGSLPRRRCRRSSPLHLTTAVGLALIPPNTRHILDSPISIAHHTKWVRRLRSLQPRPAPSTAVPSAPSAAASVAR